MTYANQLSLSSLSLLATLALGCTIVQSGDDDGSSSADTGNTSQSGDPTGNETGDEPTGGAETGEVPPETLPPPPDVASEGLHIALTGDDASGDGSAGAPYRTIQYVLDNVAGPGSVLLVHEGQYDEAVRIRHSGPDAAVGARGAGPHRVPGVDRRECAAAVRGDRRGDVGGDAARARGVGRVLCGVPRVAVGLRRHAARQPGGAFGGDRGLRAARHRARRREGAGGLRRRDDPPLRDLQLGDGLPGRARRRRRRTRRASTRSTRTGCTSRTRTSTTRRPRACT
jgi:hypothetical protein